MAEETSPPIQYREATAEDLPTIIGMLANDPIAAKREQLEHPLPAGYRSAFDAISADANNAIWLAVAGDAILGVLQLTIIPNLTYVGRPRAQIEGVRVAEQARGQGIGRQLIEHAIGLAAAAGCHLVQLTTDKQRPDALRFYEGLGFVASHEGMKRKLI